jgi:signal transduction histidine kinase
MADLLESEDIPPEKRLEFIANLQQGLTRMDWLVKSLLKLARLDTGTEPLKRENATLSGLIAEAAGNIAAITELREQELIAEGGESVAVDCDINWTVEAVANILKNASDHSPEGGAVRVSAGENPVCAWIRVEDGGDGIDPADLPHLFRRFYKGKNASRDSVGIGLAMSLSIMRAQNGDIEVATEKGQGSAFTLKFYK